MVCPNKNNIFSSSLNCHHGSIYYWGLGGENSTGARSGGCDPEGGRGAERDRRGPGLLQAAVQQPGLRGLGCALPCGGYSRGQHLISRNREKAPRPTDPREGQGSWPAESREQGQEAGGNVIVLCKRSYYYYYYYCYYFQGWACTRAAHMACDICAAMLSPGTGPGAPSQ